LLELGDTNVTRAAYYNELRVKLGLPSADPVDPAQVDVLRLPSVRLGRLDLSKMTDEQLLTVFQRSLLKGLVRNLHPLAATMLARESLQDKINRDTLYDVAVRTSPDVAQALGYLEEARRSAEQQKRSPARWLVAELPLRIIRGEAAEVNRILQTIQAKHMREPGIAEAVQRTLAQFGLLPAQRPAQEPAPAAVAAAAPAAETKQLWTPDAPSTPAPTATKSKLWVPGMD
jgi:hypothetical protein